MTPEAQLCPACRAEFVDVKRDREVARYVLTCLAGHIFTALGVRKRAHCYDTYIQVAAAGLEDRGQDATILP